MSLTSPGAPVSPDASPALMPASRIQREEVKEIAALARLALREDEVDQITQDLGAILGYIETLRELDTAAVAPMTHAVPFDCPLRPDVEMPPLTADEALRNAPRREADFFQVPRIVPAGGGEQGG